jgi:hypothetical protein
MDTPRRVEHQQTDRGYVPVYATGTVEQPWASYSKIDHEVWDTLYRRQRELLPAYACQEFLDGVDRFGLGDGGIPRFDDLNKVLGKATGWEVVGVEGLLPDEVFFDHLANRRFPVSWWIRKPDQLDYLAEPDLFHDLFGHVPLLLNPVFADYMQAYGKGGMKAHAIGPDALMNLTRLYWYTHLRRGHRQFEGRVHLFDRFAGAESDRVRPGAGHEYPVQDRHLPADLLRDRRLRATVRRDSPGLHPDLREARGRDTRGGGGRAGDGQGVSARHARRLRFRRRQLKLNDGLTNGSLRWTQLH